jgi:hypothetical protein
MLYIYTHKPSGLVDRKIELFSKETLIGAFEAQ